jgi:hypothetical protein
MPAFSREIETVEDKFRFPASPPIILRRVEDAAPYQ